MNFRMVVWLSGTLFILIPQSLVAQQKAQKKDEAKIKSSEESKFPTIPQGHHQLSVRTGGGFFDFLGLIGSVSTDYYPTPGKALTFEYARAEGLFATDNRFYEIGGRWFLGKTFYVQNGLALRHTVYEPIFHNALADAVGSGVKVEGDYRDIGVGLRIGNQWHFRAFTLGCDWAGAYIPVKKIRSHATGIDAETGAPVDYDADGVLERDLGGSDVRPYAARFYLGVSF